MLSDLKSSRLRELHAILAEMRTRGPYDDRVGICANVAGSHMRDSYYEELNVLFWTWPEFSGSKNYPVPHPAGGSASEAYNTLQMWPCTCCPSESHSYAAARMRLLEYCIVVIDDELTLRADNGSFVWK